MATKPLPDIDTLHQLLRYEPDTGKLFWKERDDVRPGWNTRWAGKEAFTANDGHGYKMGRISYTIFRAHRVIMAMVNGEWPAHEVDHINGDRADNRRKNLRLVTRTENGRNTRKPAHNTSKVVGVSWHKASGKWRASIKTNGMGKHLGVFPRKADAIAARKAAEAELGFHENHGRSSATPNNEAR